LALDIFLNVPIGLVTIWLIWQFFDEERKTSHTPIDYWGSIWLMLTLLTIMCAIQIMEKGITLLLVSLFIIAVLCFWLFIRTENERSIRLFHWIYLKIRLSMSKI